MSEVTAHYHFVTGKLAESALRPVVARLADELDFAYSIQVLPITVAALMTPAWIARHLQLPAATTAVVLPGYCRGNLDVIPVPAAVDLQRGPRDLYDLPEFFGQSGSAHPEYGAYEIEILAEINHAPDLSLEHVIRTAQHLTAAGADVVDLGCNPGGTWNDIGSYVAALRDRGMRVSVDSFNAREIHMAVAAGAELVLSANSQNIEALLDLDAELVVIPDDPQTLAGLDALIERLEGAGRAWRVDPVLAPVGCGFTDSLLRYAEVRRRYPAAPMLMGIGNLTELTDVDSAGINVLLMGICAELGIQSVLTTQVIPWAQTAVRECDLARRLVHYAVQNRTAPKRLDDRLVMLRDPRLHQLGQAELADLASRFKDPNYRIHVNDQGIHLLAAHLLLSDRDPYQLFRQLMDRQPRNLDVSHAFYLGYEFAKAKTALTLGKQYRQDEALDWGFLTEPEQTHQQRRILPLPGDRPPTERRDS